MMVPLLDEELLLLEPQPPLEDDDPQQPPLEQLEPQDE
jgi:hypothetical protein